MVVSFEAALSVVAEEKPWHVGCSILEQVSGC
jgi:hypothetical protein